MESPVLAALVNARQQQEKSAFGRWCMKAGVRCLPASPSHVAAFVKDCPPVLEAICAALAEVSEAHISGGYADPCCGAVTDAVNAIAKIAPPRSWTGDAKRMFERLPLDLQTYVVERETQRDTALRRAQNKLADERAAIQQPKQKETNNGIH